MLIKNSFICSNCDFQIRKWQGQCPSCLQWNSLELESILNEKKHNLEIPKKDLKRISRRTLKTSLDAFDKVLGNGLVEGSLILLTGEPGSGKSTLVSQIICGVQQKAFYFSGEETTEQALDRFIRLKLNHELVEIFFENKLSRIKKYIEKYQPKLVVIDSIQTVYADDELRPGGINSIKDVICDLLVVSKKFNISIIVIGHVTKTGGFAGPKLLEHMVDVYLSLSYDKTFGTKNLKAEKNRFGPTENIGFFKMTKLGLVETSFPGEYLNCSSLDLEPGSVLSFFQFGPKVGLVLISAMLCENFEKNGKRVAENFNQNRFHILCAKIENIFEINLKKFDIYLEVPELLDNSQKHIELAIVVAILSSFYKKQFNNKSIFFGSTTMSGKINKFKNLRFENFKNSEIFFGPETKTPINHLIDLKVFFNA